MKNPHRKVKYTVHRKVTTIPETLVNGLPKVLKITMTDPSATDSSSDEEDNNIFRSPATRVKRYVEEIRFSDVKREKPARKAAVKTVDKGYGTTVKYRGVRQRPWGKFAAEIRDSSTKTRIWIGTFATAYEAAIGYDEAAIKLKGHNALTNFLTPPPPPPVSSDCSPVVIETPVIDTETVSVSGCDSVSSLCSPTSVLRFNKETEFKTEYGTECETEQNKVCSGGFGTEEQNKVCCSGETKAVKEESTDPFFIPDLFQSGDFFWDSNISPNDPLFLQEMDSEMFSTEKDSDLFKGFSLDMIGDFDSCSWDVDEFFRD